MPRPLARAFRRLGTLGALAVAALAPGAASAQLTGRSIGGQFLFPTTGTLVQDLGSAVVGPGLEFTFVAQAQLDAEDARLTFRAIPGAGPVAWLAAAFNGPRIYDVGGTIPAFTSVTIDAATSLPGFDASRVTWNADEVFINVQGLVQLPGQDVVLDIGFATVPEPATVALVATGLLAAAAVRRRGRSPSSSGWG